MSAGHPARRDARGRIERERTGPRRSDAACQTAVPLAQGTKSAVPVGRRAGPRRPARAASCRRRPGPASGDPSRAEEGDRPPGGASTSPREGPQAGSPDRASAQALELYYADRLSAELFAEQEARLSTQIEAVRREREEREAERARLSDVAARFEEVARILREMDVRRLWDEATDAERSVLVEELLDAVAMYPRPSGGDRQRGSTAQRDTQRGWSRAWGVAVLWCRRPVTNQSHTGLGARRADSRSLSRGWRVRLGTRDDLDESSTGFDLASRPGPCGNPWLSFVLAATRLRPVEHAPLQVALSLLPGTRASRRPRRTR